MNSIVLDNVTKPVEGLVVDTKMGGVRFRNHTLPEGLKYGATWMEDLLFIEPQSSCVNLNLTLDFTVHANRSGLVASSLSELYLVDQGGFSALNTTYPFYDHANAQNDPDLQARAYKAAYLNNAYAMAFLNVTNPNNSSYGNKSFSYINSSLGRRFPLQTSTYSTYNTLSISRQFGSFLPLVSSSNSYPNPFNISTDDFTRTYISCSGATSVDIANISNIYVACGLIRGVPRRVDGGSSFTYEGGSRWSTSLHSCTSAMRATIKTVSFLLNGTSNIENLHITDMRDKEYSDNSSMPLWGVEDSGLTNDGISPVWGLVDPTYEGYPNISLVRKPSLYLPGFSDQFSISLENVAGGYFEYLPGSNFPPLTMNTVFAIGDLPNVEKPITVDYSGYQNMAMFLRWQNLSATPEGTASIINLIWTDLAAAAVVGTKGVLGSDNAGLSDETVTMTVVPIVHRIKYHLAFGTAAYILAFVLVLIALLALVSTVAGKSSCAKLRTLLYQSSTGRIFTTILYPEKSNLAMSSKKWSRENGKAKIEVSEISQFLNSRQVANDNEGVVVHYKGENAERKPWPAPHVEQNVTEQNVTEENVTEENVTEEISTENIMEHH